MDDELLVCDVPSDAAHLLNETAARVWEACDGERDLAELAAYCNLDRDTVTLALDRLSACGLLEADEPATFSRGKMLRFGIAAGVAAPVIESIAMPNPALAAAFSGPAPTTGVPPPP
jgi:hypothetical protein